MPLQGFTVAYKKFSPPLQASLPFSSKVSSASANPKASFQYDLHTGRLMSSWNPDGIEVNTNIIGGIALKYQGSPFMELTPAMKAAMERSNRYFFGDSWGSVSVWTGKPIVDLANLDLGKDCGDDGMEMMGNGSKSDPCEIHSSDHCKEVYEKYMQCIMKGRKIVLNQKTCNKISSCKKQIDNLIDNKPHCLESDWAGHANCWWWGVSSGARFLRGKGREYAHQVQDAFSAMYTACGSGGYD